MKTSHVTFAFWVALSAAAGQPLAIDVRLYNYAGVPGDVLQKAKLESQRVLQAARFEIQLLDCPLRDGPMEPAYLACTKPMNPADILLRIVPRSMQPEQVPDHSLGYALPFVGRPAARAYVLYDRVRDKARRYDGISEFRLLGYVMAHEVAHLLFGDDRHSRRGLMMAFWRETDLVEIERGTMAFSQDEARLIELGVISRIQSNRVH